MNFTQSETNQLLEIMRWRRDVRHFKTDSISQEHIEILKQAIDLSPSVGNSRPWRFINVQSLDIRHEIIENYERCNAKAALKYSDDEYQKYLNLKLAGLKEAPFHLAVFTDLNPRAGKGLGRQTMPETLIYSTIGAIQQLWLAARTLNLGVGWVSILDPDQIISALDAPSDWHFTAYLCIGYPQFQDDMPELQRKDWQANTKTEWLIR